MQIFKIFLSTDCFLKLESMKSKSLVIANQNVAVNRYLGLEQTACHVLEMCLFKADSC
jgi:hypothetical protein